VAILIELVCVVSFGVDHFLEALDHGRGLMIILAIDLGTTLFAAAAMIALPFPLLR